MTESYIPLYRKYRPQTFDDLVGQEVVSKALCNAIELSKISHAYLFTGSRGTGKTSAARILAKSLNCKNGPTIHPCGICENCQNIAIGKALDVIEIDAASNNGVEDARDIIEKVQFVPVSGKYKIFIIDEVHMLTPAAFNALLKTIEEPPKNLVFILATTESHKVIETIVSRCQRFDFQKITIKDIEKRISYIASEEKIKITNEAISLISNRAAGGMRDALALLDQASVLGIDGHEIDVDDILQITGSLSEEDLYSITAALADKNISNLLKYLNKIIMQGNEPILILKELIEYFRNLLLLKSAQSSEEVKNLINITENYLQKVKEQSKKFEVIEIAQIIEKMVEYEYNLKNTTNQILIIEVILISILYRQDILLIKNLESRVSELEAALQSNKVSIKTTEQQVSYIQEAKSALVENISSKNIVLNQKQVSENEDNKNQSDIKEIKIKESQTQVFQEVDKEEIKFQSSETATKNSENSCDEKAWADLLSILSPSQRSFYMQMTKPVEISQEKIVIAVKNDTWLKNIQESNKLKELQDAVKQLFHHQLKIQLMTFEDVKNTKKKFLVQPEFDITPKSQMPSVVTETSQVLKRQERSNSQPTKEDLEEFKEVKSAISQKITLLEPEEQNSLNKIRGIEINPESKYTESIDMIVDLFQGKVIE